MKLSLKKKLLFIKEVYMLNKSRKRYRSLCKVHYYSCNLIDNALSTQGLPHRLRGKYEASFGNLCGGVVPIKNEGYKLALKRIIKMSIFTLKLVFNRL